METKQMLEVFIKTLTGKTLRVLATGTAAGVKKELQIKEGVPQEKQRLIFAGKELRDEQLLRDSGVQRHSTIELVLRLPGGGPNCSTCAGRGAGKTTSSWAGTATAAGGAAAPVQGDRKALPLLDGVVGGAGVEAIVSFPGKYQDEWNEMVATVLLLKYLAQKMQLREDHVPNILSTACIFLPDGDKNYGQHHLNDVDPHEISAGHCFCHKLYGEEKEWGCQWFHIWRGKLEEVLDKGQEPVVVYKAGEKGEEDDTPWDRFPIPFSTEHRGLGGSQKGEVAYLRRRLEERGITRFEKLDVNEASEATLDKSFFHLSQIVKGAAGGAALADAIEHCKEVQDALGTLTLADAELGEGGGKALARSLPCLRALQRLVLGSCRLGQEGGKEVATSLQHLPKLVELHLANDNFGPEAGEALAVNLRHLPELLRLHLFSIQLGDAAGQAIAASLQHLVKLRDLHLGHNGLGEGAGKAVAASLLYLPELARLNLGANGLGDEAGQALAASLRNLPKLNSLHLSESQLGEEAGKALASNLQHTPALDELWLMDNRLGEGAGAALAASLEQLPLLTHLYLSNNPLGERAESLLREKWGTRDASCLNLERT